MSEWANSMIELFTKRKSFRFHIRLLTLVFLCGGRHWLCWDVTRDFSYIQRVEAWGGWTMSLAGDKCRQGRENRFSFCWFYCFLYVGERKLPNTHKFLNKLSMQASKGKRQKLQKFRSFIPFYRVSLKFVFIVAEWKLKSADDTHIQIHKMSLLFAHFTRLFFFSTEQ